MEDTIDSHPEVIFSAKQPEPHHQCRPAGKLGTLTILNWVSATRPWAGQEHDALTGAISAVWRGSNRD